MSNEWWTKWTLWTGWTNYSLLVAHHSLLISAILTMTFSELAGKNFDNEKVEIRGFVYSLPNGQWVMASKPNLKSCCVGASNKNSEQIFLSKNDIGYPLNRAITVQGILKTRSEYDKNGNPMITYSLEDTTMVTKEFSISSLWQWLF